MRQRVTDIVHTQKIPEYVIPIVMDVLSSLIHREQCHHIDPYVSQTLEHIGVVSTQTMHGYPVFEFKDNTSCIQAAREMPDSVREVESFYRFQISKLKEDESYLQQNWNAFKHTFQIE